MKKLLPAFLMILYCGGAYAQPSALEGAWTLRESNTHYVVLIQDGYLTFTDYTGEAFINTWGGPYNLNNNTIQIKLEFNARNKEQTGTTKNMPFQLKENQLTLQTGDATQAFTRADHNDAPLSGVWKITGRQQDGKLMEIHQTGPRKTLKMLTGNRFQWFAINPATKEFSGTGGGTYTFKNGKYTENILFFSRDNSRVGASLSFDGKIKDGKWHHSGLSSKGDPIYEVWGKVKDQ